MQQVHKSSAVRRRVAILVHTASDWTRGVLQGVSNYVRGADCNWNVFLEPRGFHEQLSLPSHFECDGVILRMTHAALEKSISRDKALPAVNVSWLGEHSSRVPKVVSDERSCAEMSVEHLRDRGYAHIGYFGPERQLGYSDTIRRVLEKSVESADHIVPSAGRRSHVSRKVEKWLKQVPKPIGIVAWNTAVSKRILDTALELGLHVPHEVGIVCIEHDHLIASMSETPLTSIDQDPLMVGYEAARLLESLMAGNSSPSEPILIRPQGVICRQSTDTASTSDEVVKAALEFIQSNFPKPIRVGDVCAQLDVSRRKLEHRFRIAINSTPANEIRRVRLANVKRLLVETSLSLREVALLSGYDYAEVMSRAFKKAFGTTPGDFRKLR